MLKSLIVLITIFFTFATIDCYRDQPSSYNTGKLQSITLLNPQGGERFTADQPINVQWVSVNMTGNLRIELIDSTTEVYSVNNIPDSGSYILQIPESAFPSKSYHLKIESMIYPEIFDINKYDFEIAPDINGSWFYSNVNEGSGLEVNLDLSAYVGESFLGDGTFYFKYYIHGELRGYESNVTAGGILSFPQIGFKIRGNNNREFDFTGQMVTVDIIKGKIIGFVDSTYGSIDDSLTLVKQ
jgi:hypothetical protein